MSAVFPYSIGRVGYGSPGYRKTVALRHDILRKPLGMEFTAGQLAAEAGQDHIAVFGDGGEVVACCVLLLHHGKAKMRQVAVAAHLQRKGIGAELCRWCAQFAKNRGCELIYCHARAVAAPFYEKLGYAVVGEPFTEVGLKHFYMEKRL